MRSPHRGPEFGRYRNSRIAALGRSSSGLLPAGESECILSIEGDVDETVRRAQAGAATIVTEPAQQPWGYTGAFADPDRISGW